MNTTQLSPVKMVDTVIALYAVTSQNARFCHWNVTGPLFEDNHEIFGEIYDFLSDEIDTLAERVRALKEFPMSQLAKYLETANMDEYALPMNAAQMQMALLGDLETISQTLEDFAQNIANDVVTQDIFVGSKREIDKKAWMLRAILNK